MPLDVFFFFRSHLPSPEEIAEALLSKGFPDMTHKGEGDLVHGHGQQE